MVGLNDFGRMKFPRADLVASSGARRWKGLCAEIRNHPAGEIPPPVPQQLEMTLALSDAGGARVERRANGQLQDTPVQAGTLWLCPTGVFEDSIRIGADLTNVMHVFVGSDIFRDISDLLSRPVSSGDIQYIAGIDDDFLRGVGYRISEELGQETACGAMLVEGLARAMAAHLVSRYSGAGLIDASAAGITIEDRRLRRVIGFINENIETDISLSTLADLACLSRHHFARAFRTATGVPPHRFISALRFKRAQELLAHSEASLADVALSCGFSSQSTFTRAFRRQLGVSPGEFRRSARI